MMDEKPEENLIQCIYASAAAVEFSSTELDKLLSESRKNNKSIGITGMLLYEKGSFFQVLEGEKGFVESLYEKINSDKRHAKIVKLIVEPIEVRSFGLWSMGLAGVSVKQLSEVEGLNDFFQSGACFNELDNGRAKKLLMSFKEGKWRSTISGDD